MRPRVHRYLVGQLDQLRVDITDLPKQCPNHPEDYAQARSLIVDATSHAMKHSMRALTFTRRGERDEAASEWWAFRRAVRKATMFHGFARCLTEIKEVTP
jgi:hypothetical protein